MLRKYSISVPKNSAAEETEHTLKDETCYVEGYTARQLRSLQRQAAALAQLPTAVRTALDAVTDHIEMLLREPTPTPSPSPEPDLNTHMNYSVTSAEFTVILKNITTEDLEVEEMDRTASLREISRAENNSPVLSDCSEESIQQTVKQQKMEILNKSWPWTSKNKPIYKIADHYEAVYAKCIDNKVKWLEGKISEEQLFTEKIKIRR